MKKSFFVFCIFLFSGSVNGSLLYAQGINEGKMRIELNTALHANGAKVMLYREWPSRRLIDSGIINNGTWTFNLKDTLPAAYALRIRKPFINANLLLEKGVCIVTLNKDSQLIVKGGALQNRLLQYEAKVKPLQEKWAIASQAYTNAKDLENKLIAAKSNQEWAEKTQTAKMAFIKSNADNACGAWITHANMFSWGLADLRNLAAYFKQQIPLATPLLKEIEDKMKTFEALQMTGKKAPLFSIVSIDGSMVSLDSVIKANKYVLLDFWASWCTPCRATNRKLSPFYQKFKEKGIEVISVSVDEDRELWEKAVAYDKIAWLQLRSPSLKKGIAEDYKVEVLPTTFLIDNKGFIIKQQLSAADLEKLL